MSSAADDLVAVVRLLVDQPGDVRAQERSLRAGGAAVAAVADGAADAELVLSVAPADRGKVIGRRGRTIDALRLLARERGAHEGRELELELLDD